MPLAVKTILAVAPAPAEFGRLARIEPVGADSVKLIGENGDEITAAIDLKFLQNNDA
jgi:hypothetical protein